MSLRLRKPSDDYSSMLRQEDPPPPSKRYIRRWRIAVTAISVTRFLVGFTKKVVEKNDELLQSLSFVTINIEGRGDKRVLNFDIDPQGLA
ncbi:hypothetical protein CRYUN_Cryun08bG0025400 [Craigia yunnanensis]